MERNFHIDDFEEFLKEKADQYKMYPSDKVWNNIHKSVHPRKKWPYITLTLLLLLGTAIFVDTHNLISVRHISFNSNSNKVTPAVSLVSIHDSDFRPQQFSTGNNNTDNTSIQTPLSSTRLFISSRLKSKEKIVHESHHATDTQEIELSDSQPLPMHPSAGNVLKQQLAKTAPNTGENQEVKKVLWGGEPFKKSRIKWQLFFSPVVSYRRLSSELNEVTDVFRGIPYRITQETTSVNNLVTHKPAIGAEVGATMVYRLTDNFSLKAGLQLNYSRYQLRAYATKPERITLAVVDRPMGGDSINVISTLKNFSGNGSSWFNNEYLQVALPIGFEWGVLGNSTLRWNVAASAQPVYNFSNNQYLLSTNFERYGQDPSLIRKWNINAGVETYVSYNMGSFKWQVGPQLRYQLMSSFRSSYPVKEYLVDYGFKIGVTKTIR